MILSYKEIVERLQTEPWIIIRFNSGEINYYVKTKRGKYLIMQQWDNEGVILEIQKTNNKNAYYGYFYDYVPSQSWYRKRYFEPLMMTEML